jgi:hypothetical protein
VDAYNESLGQYETVFEVDETGAITSGSIGNIDIQAAGSDGDIQYRAPDGKLSAESDLNYDEDNNQLFIRDGTLTNGVSGIFNGFLDPVTKILFPYEQFTEDADLPRVSGRATVASFQGGFDYRQETNEILDDPSTFLYSYQSESRIRANNSQGYVEIDGSTNLSVVDYLSFLRLENVKHVNASDTAVQSSAHRVQIRGDNTEITGNADIASVAAFTEFYDNATVVGPKGSSSTLFFSDSFEGQVLGVTAASLATIGGEFTDGTFDGLSPYGFYQERPDITNLFEGTFSQSSGDLVLAKDNRRFEAELNQRTTTGAEAVLAKDSQNRNLKPVIPESGTWHFEANVTARVVGSSNSLAMEGDTHVWKIEGVASSTFNESLGQRDVRFVGNPSVVTVATDIPTQDYSVSVNINGQGELEIAVQGSSGDTVHWMASLDVEELSQ